MAILCLATDLEDLDGASTASSSAYDPDGEPGDRREKSRPPAPWRVLLQGRAACPTSCRRSRAARRIVHGGPFANIAHGCNSVLATAHGAEARRLCRHRGRLRRRSRRGEVLRHQVPHAPGWCPPARCIVATMRALKMHGGVAGADLEKANLAAVERGMREPGEAHREHARASACRVVVAINRFPDDTDAEIAGRPASARGRRGARRCSAPLGRRRRRRGGTGRARSSRIAEAARPTFRRSTLDDMPLWRQDRDRRARKSTAPTRRRRRQAARDQISPSSRGSATAGLPVCMAKTQYSFSTDPTLRGAPSGTTSPCARCGSPPAPASSSCTCRRHHDHARPAARPRRQRHPPQRRRRDRRAVLRLLVPSLAKGASRRSRAHRFERSSAPNRFPLPVAPKEERYGPFASESRTLR